MNASGCSTLAMCEACGILTNFAPGTVWPMCFVPGAAPSASPVIASSGRLISSSRAVVLRPMIARPQLLPDAEYQE